MKETEILAKEIQFYEKKVKDYLNGDVDPNIRGIRAVMGVYAERENERYMTRIKIPAGMLTIKQLEGISDIADKYSRGRIHFTTRQDIQFHSVELKNTVKIMKEAFKLGISTLGAGGNCVRNVACSPLSGVEKDEIFDVTPYAVAVSKFLEKDPSTRKLPRKYKLAFSNNEKDTAYATIADLGFVARIEGGRKGFELYGAGGLGGSPAISLKLENFIDAKDVLYYVEAMKELFFNEGDRDNRNKARIRYIVYRLGEENFRELFKEYVAKVKNSMKLDLRLNDEEYNYLHVSGRLLPKPLVTEQKQAGYYSIYVHPEEGYISTSNLKKIFNFLSTLDYETSIRLTNSQGFYIRDIKANDVDKLLTIIYEFSTKYHIDSILHCVGSTVCGIGLCNSSGLSSKIRERFQNASEDVKKALPKIFISGCPNSCGQHQIGSIGFSGKSLKGGDGMIPAYRIYFGGTVGVSKTKFGEPKGDIAAKKIPDFLYRLACLAVEYNNGDFRKFIIEEWNKVEALIKEFEIIEEDSGLYFDFNSTIKFLSKSTKAM